MSSQYKPVNPYRQVQHMIVHELIQRDIGGLCSKGRHDMETFSIRVDVLWVVGRPFEGAGSKATSLDLIVPNILVDGLEVIFQNQTVLLECQLAFQCVTCLL